MCCDCLCIELNGPEQITVVRNRHCIHLQLPASLEQFVERYSAIKQRILTVQMKMCKSFICHSLRYPPNRKVRFNMIDRPISLVKIKMPGF
jgi:hypothetical protein